MLFKQSSQFQFMEMATSKSCLIASLSNVSRAFLTRGEKEVRRETESEGKESDEFS